MNVKEVQSKKRLNQLDGKTWARYSISIWDIAKTPEEAKIRHPAMFPVELPKRLIEIYTMPGEVVLDPFMGSGSTLVAAKMLRRKGIGFDVVPEYVELAKKRLSDVGAISKFLGDSVPEPEVYCEDARNLLKYVKPESIDLCVTSPPYWIVHRRKRTADYKEPRPYSDLKDDLGNIEDYGEFLRELSKVFRNVYITLKPGKRCVVVVMDIRVGSEFIPYHMDVTRMMEQIGYVLEDIIIWDRRREYNNLRPLGYPYIFVVNKVHEYILIFKKPNSTTLGITPKGRFDRNV